MPLNLPPFLKTIFSGGDLVKNVGQIIDNLNLSPEEKEKAKLAFLQETNRAEEAVHAAYLKEKELENADRDSARAMQTAALAQTDLFSKRFMYYLAGFVVVSSVAYGIALLFIEIPENNKRMVEQFSDMFLLTGALMVLSFFFGAAHRSADSKQAK